MQFEFKSGEENPFRLFVCAISKLSLTFRPWALSNQTSEFKFPWIAPVRFPFTPFVPKYQLPPSPLEIYNWGLRFTIYKFSQSCQCTKSQSCKWESWSGLSFCFVIAWISPQTSHCPLSSWWQIPNNRNFALIPCEETINSCLETNKSLTKALKAWLKSKSSTGML